jgi:fructosamine-3-kinase
MDPVLKQHIENALNCTVINAAPVSGGDISKAYKIITRSGCFFCKYHHGANGFLMLKSEKEGLEAILASRTIRAPRVLYLGALNKGGVLLMEYIEAKSPSDRDMERLGRGLASLHKVSADVFGWTSDNYIGSLPQKNTPNASWPEFYVENRLLPQLVLAIDHGRLRRGEVPERTELLAGITKHCKADTPSLIHGDLWGGNYLIDEQGEAVLIDPSISYADPGMDLAMSKLFGGFSSSFYDAYAESFPSPLATKAAIELYQLYYLSVHLNLFGASYAPAVRSILKRYF